MADKTFNFNIIGTVDDLKAYQSGTVVNTRILDGVTSLHPYIFYNMTSLQSVDFNQVEIIPIDCCRGCTNLTQAVFSTHTTQIGEYAFYNCTKFEDAELPHTLTNIGQYAFYYAGSYYSRGTHTFTMIDDVGIHTTIQQNAFYNSHLSEIDAYTNNIGSYAFQECKSLTDVNIEIHGSLGASAFQGCTYVENFCISPQSVITSLGNSAFATLSRYVDSASRNISSFDFRNSTFTSIGSSVWSDNRYDGNVFFPQTLSTISGNFMDSSSQGNWKLYFNSIPAVSSSSYLRNNTSNFTVKYCFPYEMLEEASTTTNWSSHTSQMIGYGTGFEAGVVLPQYMRTTGVTITWYSDETLTTQITTSSSSADIYYCVLGQARAVWYVSQVSTHAASVVISDGINLYNVGDPVPVNTALTITTAPTSLTETSLYNFKVNNIDYTSTGSATITMTQDLIVYSMYWNGVDVPFADVLADNDWASIQLASKMNLVPSTWHIGDTKNITYNGQTYPVRLVDKSGKFRRTADGSVAYLYFEFGNVLPNASYYADTGGVWAPYDPTHSIVLDYINSAEFLNNLDVSLTSIIEPIDVQFAVASNMLTTMSLNFFLARERDISNTQYSSFTNEFNVLTTDAYYAQEGAGASALRVKTKVGDSAACRYWLISPHADTVIYQQSMIGDDGTCSWVSGGTASVKPYIAPRFVL